MQPLDQEYGNPVRLRRWHLTESGPACPWDALPLASLAPDVVASIRSQNAAVAQAWADYEAYRAASALSKQDEPAATIEQTTMAGEPETVPNPAHATWAEAQALVASVLGGVLALECVLAGEPVATIPGDGEHPEPVPNPAHEAWAAAVATLEAAGVGFLLTSAPLPADPLASLPPSAGQLTAYADEAKWRKEVGGILVNGVPVATDDRSKLLLAGARMAAEANSEWTTQWHVGGGVMVPLGAAQIIAISNAVLAHVDACFAMFGAVVAAIGAGTITTTAQIDAAFAAV